MFNVGGGELLVIMLVALVVLGPQKLPEAARKVGNAMGELRKLSSGFQAEMRSALSDVDKADVSEKTKPAAKRDKPTKALKPGTTMEQGSAARADEPVAALAAGEEPVAALVAPDEPVAALAAGEDALADEPTAEPTGTGEGIAVPAAKGPTPATAEVDSPASGPNPLAGNGASVDVEPADESAGPLSGPRR